MTKPQFHFNLIAMYRPIYNKTHIGVGGDNTSTWPHFSNDEHLGYTFTTNPHSITTEDAERALVDSHPTNARDILLICHFTGKIQANGHNYNNPKLMLNTAHVGSKSDNNNYGIPFQTKLAKLFPLSNEIKNHGQNVKGNTCSSFAWSKD